MSDFKPCDNETELLNVGKLSVENRVDGVTLQGNVVSDARPQGSGAGA